MKFNFFTLVTAACLMSLMISCKKDKKEPGIDPYTVPATYNFDNSDYKESAARISMWFAYTGNLGRSNVRMLSPDTVSNMWNNTNSAFAAETGSNIPYTFDQLNGLTFNLSGKTADAATFKVWADSMVNVSQHFEATASRGVPGKIGSRIFNYSGLEFNQVVAKGMMGALAFYNIIAILDKIPTDDNTNSTPGAGTAMQHNWDLAFGYVGIPKDYDTSFNYTATPVKADRPFAIGGYFAERGKYIEAGGKVFEAFRKGRAAIGAKDYAVRDAAIATIKEYLEKTIAASTYYYITAPQTQAELSAKFHGLSEAYGFIVALKYRPASSKLTAANYQKLMDIIGSNFYDLADDASNTKLKEAQGIITSAYGQLQP